MKHFKKLLCFSLAVLMLLLTLVACKNDQPITDESTLDSDVDVTDTEETTADTGWETDANGLVLDKIKDVDLNGRKIRILTGSGRMASCYSAGDNLSMPLNRAVFSRNQAVQVRLNCQLDFIEENDDHANVSAFTQRAMALSSTGEVDMFAVYSMTTTSMMINGVLADLMPSDALHFEAPWWSSKMVDTCTLYDRMYFCTGDISYELLGIAYVMLFNKNLAASMNVPEYLSQVHDAETMYDLVRSGDWTIDTMMNIAKQFYVDSDGMKTGDDVFGYATTVIFLDAFYSGSGLKLLERGNDGSVIVSDDMGSYKADKLASDIVEFMKTPSVTVYSTFAKAGDGENGIWQKHLWNANQVLMYHATLGEILDETKFDVGVLPNPKYDKDQTEYLTCTGFPYGMWGISRTATNYEDLCYVLECMASESYRKITPVYYDQMLLGRRDTKDDYEMLQAISETIVIDGGRVMTNAFGDWTYYVFRGALASGISYLPYYEKRKEFLKESALGLNSLILNMEELYR